MAHFVRLLTCECTDQTLSEAADQISRGSVGSDMDRSGCCQEAYRQAAAEWHRALRSGDGRPLVEEQLNPSQWDPLLVLQRHIVS